MHAIGCLTEDHRQLSSKLVVLETALAAGEESEVLLEDCCAVVDLLHEHIAREERFVGACSRALGPISAVQLNWLAIDHTEAYRRLQMIAWLLGEELPSCSGGIRVNLIGAMVILRHQIDEQEAKLFPFLRPVMDRVEPLQPKPPPDVSSMTGRSSL